MAKKILIGFLLVLFSAISILFSQYSALYSELDKYVVELIEEKEFDKVYNAVFGGTIVNDNIVFEEEDEDMTIHVYQSLVSFYKDIEVDKTIRTVTDEYTEGIEIVFYNASSKFTKVDEVVIPGYTGRVEVSRYSEYLYNSYNIYSIVIDTTDITLENVINNVQLFDSSDNLIYNVDLSNTTNPLQFSNEDSNLWSSYVTKYMEYQTELTADQEYVDDEKMTELVELQKENLEASSFSVNGITQDVITARTGYKVITTITIVLVILVNMVVIYFVFIKNRKKGLPIVKLDPKKDIVDTTSTEKQED